MRFFRRRAGEGAIERRLRALVGQAPSIFFVIDLGGRVVMAEGRLLRALGRRAAPGVGRTVAELFPDAPWVHEAIQRALAGRTGTARGLLGDRFYEARFAAVRDDRGQLLEVVGLATDTSELHEAEERLRRQAFRLEAQAEASRAFSSGLDEQATLETVARRLCELIGDGSLIRLVSADGRWLVPAALHHPDPRREALRREVLTASERAGQRLEKLVEALLDVSRIHMGRLELDVTEVELGAVVAEAAAALADELAQAGSPLVVRGEVVMGRWDPLRIGQVVVNLLANAAKYGAGKPVEIRYGSLEGRAFLQVSDQGIGVAEVDQRHIFERFERAVSSQNYGGLGLGLYIVKRIVEAHGGSIGVESVPGEGATFLVDLPRQPVMTVPPSEPVGP